MRVPILCLITLFLWSGVEINAAGQPHRTGGQAGDKYSDDELLTKFYHFCYVKTGDNTFRIKRAEEISAVATNSIIVLLEQVINRDLLDKNIDEDARNLLSGLIARQRTARGAGPSGPRFAGAGSGDGGGPRRAPARAERSICELLEQIEEKIEEKIEVVKEVSTTLAGTKSVIKDKEEEVKKLQKDILKCNKDKEEWTEREQVARATKKEIDEWITKATSYHQQVLALPNVKVAPARRSGRLFGWWG